MVNKSPIPNNMRGQRIYIGEAAFGPWMLVQRGRKRKKKDILIDLNEGGRNATSQTLKGKSPLAYNLNFNLGMHFKELSY